MSTVRATEQGHRENGVRFTLHRIARKRVHLRNSLCYVPGMTDVLEWQQTACILCECNCGVEVRLAEDGRHFERIRGDKAHPASQGYTCEKALRLDFYQNGRGERVLHPLRKRPDGTFEEIDWDTAITEVA